MGENLNVFDNGNNNFMCMINTHLDYQVPSIQISQLEELKKIIKQRRPKKKKKPKNKKSSCFSVYPNVSNKMYIDCLWQV